MNTAETTRVGLNAIRSILPNLVTQRQTQQVYARSPRIRRASWMSFGMIVTRFAWIAHKLVSSNRPTRYASEASCNARIAVLWKRKSVLKSWAISRTRRWKGNLRINKSVLFGICGFREVQQYLGDNGEASLHRRRLVPIYGLPWLQVCKFNKLCVSCVYDLVTISGLVHTYCLRGAFPPVDLRAVCFVRAILRFPLFDSSVCLRRVYECWRRKALLSVGTCNHFVTSFINIIMDAGLCACSIILSYREFIFFAIIIIDDTKKQLFSLYSAITVLFKFLHSSFCPFRSNTVLHFSSSSIVSSL